MFTQFGSLSPEVGECYENFYVNGGANQPACQNSSETLCSHVYSYEYFKYSIHPENKFFGHTCRMMFFNNFCIFKEKDLMGIYTER